MTQEHAAIVAALAPVIVDGAARLSPMEELAAWVRPETAEVLFYRRDEMRQGLAAFPHAQSWAAELARPAPAGHLWLFIATPGTTEGALQAWCPPATSRASA